MRRLLRGLLARRWSSITLLLTGGLTVAAATLGPLYARAAQEAVLQDALTQAPAYDTGLHAEAPTQLNVAYAVDEQLAKMPGPGVLPEYPTRIVGVRLDIAKITTTGSREIPQKTRLIQRDGQCAHVVVVQGRCPSGPGEAMLSQRTLSGDYGYRLGSTVTMPGTVQKFAGNLDPNMLPPTDPVALTVVGVYRPIDPDDPYWFGRKYFNAALSYGDGGSDTIDAVIVQRSTFTLFAAAIGVLDADLPVEPSAIRLSNRERVAAGVDDLLSHPPTDVTLQDPLPDALGSVDADNREVATGSLLVSLQLAALALLVLFAATGDALDGRGSDVALAKLRGLGAFATLRFLLSETAVLLLLAVPLGVALGVIATHVLAGIVLLPGLPVVVPAAAWIAAGAAFVGALVAAALAGRRVLTRTVLEQWRGTRRATGRRVATLVGEAVVTLAALAGLGLLLAGDGSTYSLVAPGLLVLAVALLGVRIVPLVVRLAVPRTAGGARLGRFLAVRQVARRPAALRLAVLLAVAIGLAVFAVGGESVAVGNRTARAEVETGAPQVVAVTFPLEDDPRALVAQADPDGDWAMTAAKWLPAGGTTVTGAVEAVDASRFTSVAFPTSHGPSLADIVHGIDPEPIDPVRITGAEVAVTITGSDLSGPAPYVEVLLQPTGRGPEGVRLGTLRAGEQVYRGAIPCEKGCLLGGFGWTRPSSSFDPIGGTARLTAVSASDGDASTPVDLHFDQPAGWRARSPDATDSATTNQVTVTPDGVTDTFTSSGGSSAGLAHTNGPSPLPLWTSPGAIIRPPDHDDGSPGTPAVVDTFGNAYPVSVAGTTNVLPGVRVGGVIGDLASLRDQLPGFTGEAQWQVWVGRDAPADAFDRLRAVGFDLGTVASESDRAERLGRQGPALALALLLACAIAAAVLAIGATATAIATSGRRRSFELAALRVLGVSRRALTRATVLEQGLLLGSALLLGVPAGVVAALVAMPVIPQFSDTSPLPLHNIPQPWPVVVVVAAFLVLLVATAVVAGTALVRAAVPARLRETAQ